MEIETQVEVTLRKAGYETWLWSSGSVPIVCFENSVLIGFVYVFLNSESLLNDWAEVQQKVLKHFSPTLRNLGSKAWNVYSVFLTTESSDAFTHRIERIEEDFTLTRKIARNGIQTTADLNRALLTLLPLKSKPTLGGADYLNRLQSRLKDIPTEVVTAFLGRASATEVARMLSDEQ